MKCCVIPPKKHLDLAHMGDYYFCLAQLYYKDRKYRNFFKSLKQLSCSPYIILDNGAAEKDQIDDDLLLDIVEDLKPDEVVAPDTLYDSQDTLLRTREFIRKMTKRKLTIFTIIMGCPQGSTIEDWLNCYKAMLSIPHISVIGLSKISIPYCWMKAKHDVAIAESRNRCIDLLIRKNLIKKDLHFLGMGDPAEFEYYKTLKHGYKAYFRSTDSCYTILAAYHNIDFHKEFERVETDNSYFDIELTDNQIKLALKNIWYLRKILREV